MARAGQSLAGDQILRWLVAAPKRTGRSGFVVPLTNISKTPSQGTVEANVMWNAPWYTWWIKSPQRAGYVQHLFAEVWRTQVLPTTASKIRDATRSITAQHDLCSIASLTASVSDADGNPIPNLNPEIQFSWRWANFTPVGEYDYTLSTATGELVPDDIGQPARGLGPLPRGILKRHEFR